MAFVPAKAQVCGREGHAGMVGQVRPLEAVCGFHAIFFCSGFCTSAPQVSADVQ